MAHPKIEVELKQLKALGRRDQGDFLEEAKRLIGRTEFDALWEAGVQSVKGLYREVCRIARAPAIDYRQQQEDIRVGQDAAAQCHS